jgi:predicted DNA-binding protein YlxM (UPF0122 family)
VLLHTNNEVKRLVGLGSLCFEDQVFVMLEYYRDYPSMAKLGMEYEVDPTTIGRVIRRVEKILIASPDFKLPSKRSFQESNSSIEIEAVIVDATEMAIQKPKRRRFNLKIKKIKNRLNLQKKYWSDKKSKHTQKCQVFISKTKSKTGKHRILTTNFGKGRELTTLIYSRQTKEP